MHRITWNLDGRTSTCFSASGLLSLPEAAAQAFNACGIALAPQHALLLTAEGPKALIPDTPWPSCTDSNWLSWSPDTLVRRPRLEEITRSDSEHRALATLVLHTQDGRTVELPESPLLVGRHPACDVHIDDPRASTFHCLLLRIGTAVRVIDLASTNGTYLDGARIQHAQVVRRATLRIGRSALLLAPRQGACSFVELPSKTMAAVLQAAQRAAPTRAPVLISGESGSGKEMVARLLHELSGRPGPFVALNAAVITPNLAASELFGHVRGAFTGADRDHPGAFLAAHEGTLFLDEIGELPLDVQAILLRVVESGRLRRLGEAHETPVDVRIVAATHRNLAHRVQTGHFREDLFHRLCVIPLAVPPLRERQEDIDALACHFLATLEEPRRLAPAALARLKRHNWPGNVRELLNVLRRAVVFADGEVIQASDLELVPPLSSHGGGDIDDLIYERVLAAYAECGHQVASTAKKLGLRRAVVHRILREANKSERLALWVHDRTARYGGAR